MMSQFKLAGKYAAFRTLGLAAESLARPALSALKPIEGAIGKTTLQPLGDLTTLHGASSIPEVTSRSSGMLQPLEGPFHPKPLSLKTTGETIPGDLSAPPSTLQKSPHADYLDRPPTLAESMAGKRPYAPADPYSTSLVLDKNRGFRL